MAGTQLSVRREDVLAYRVASQELHRVDADPSALAVLDLGVQDTPQGSARLALAARTARPLDDPALTLLWTLRGAPHLHRTTDLPWLTAALWPLDDADAAGRIDVVPIRDGARRLGLAAFVQAAEAFREVVRQPLPKGEVSTAVSARVDPSLTYDCEPCNARHVSGALFQQAGLPGAVRLEPGAGRGTWLAPLAYPPPLPRSSAGVESLITAYLRLHGPAVPADVAKFLGIAPSVVRRVWPPGLAEVSVDGRRSWLPPERLSVLAAPPSQRVVRLLPAGDPYLQARDRELVVPDPRRRAAVWRALGNPGAVLVDGEIAGTWRSRASGARLAIIVTPFEPMPVRVRRELDEEAAEAAVARGLQSASVTFE